MAKRQALKYSHRASWLFGKPVLRYQNNGMAGWCKENSLSQWQKGGGWTANLYGGAQTGNDDWAAIFIPVNDMPVSEFSDAQWSYYMTGTQTMGVNIVIWVHDYEDFDKRAEITQRGNVSGLEKTRYWNSHTLNTATSQFFYYGEDWSSTAAAALAGSNLTSGTLYTWAQFQADNLFKNWSIYRISFEYGWEASGTFADVWLAEVNLNGISVPLKPSAGDHIGTEVKTITAKTPNPSTTVATLATPAAAKKIRVISVACSSLDVAKSEFEVYFVAGTNMDSNADNAIFNAVLVADTTANQSTSGSASISFPDGAGPIGGIGEVVAIRTSADITTNGRVTLVYREE